MPPPAPAGPGLTLVHAQAPPGAPVDLFAFDFDVADAVAATQRAQALPAGPRFAPAAPATYPDQPAYGFGTCRR